MQSPNNGLGRYGEEVAARRLAHEGLHILERNWRCAEGELDIVALDGDTLAICEVKTRSENAFQQPTEGIDRSKADRLRRLAERWLAERWPTYFELLAERVTYLPRSDGLVAPSTADGLPRPDCPDRDRSDRDLAAPAEAAGGRPRMKTARRTGSPARERSEQERSAQELPAREHAEAPGDKPVAGKGRARKRTATKGGATCAPDAAVLRAGPPTPPPPGGVRIDLVAVVNRLKGAAQVEHLRGAV
ncbi:YraN family protein [Kitasatospora sp. DSM 101779]|uniref:YraN family protein n=1 Tax=Kitasatospora sp. DSM 101779 TaxID=2853165 RepID=UPI0029534E52|nr:YraN family protein [Kitasatospora sp. DSM 101779]